MVQLTDGADTSAGAILTEIGRELNIEPSTLRLFALWVCSESLCLQLKPDHKPLAHLNVKKWRAKVDKWTDQENSKERPHLVLRRSAHASLAMELQASCNEFGLTLLYDEARQNFLKGFYPCKEKDTVHLAAISTRILYGNTTKMSEKPELSCILPAHMLLVNERANELWKKISKALKDVKSCNVSHLQKDFLSYCRQFRTYGATFFIAEVYMSRPHVSHLRAHCGVNDYGLHLISASTMVLMASYGHRELSWSFEVGKPFLEVHARTHGHQMTIRTPQAAYISMLLNKLSDQISS